MLNLSVPFTSFLLPIFPVHVIFPLPPTPWLLVSKYKEVAVRRRAAHPGQRADRDFGRPCPSDARVILVGRVVLEIPHGEVAVLRAEARRRVTLARSDPANARKSHQDQAYEETRGTRQVSPPGARGHPPFPRWGWGRTRPPRYGGSGTTLRHFMRSPVQSRRSARAPGYQTPGAATRKVSSRKP